MEEKISDNESFHNAYRVFHEAIEALSEPADVQCKIMGNHDVAWNLKDDVSAGLYLSNSPSSVLTESQVLAIEQLINEIDEIPENVFIAAKTEEENHAAMQHPSWEYLREHAKALIHKLKSATKKNDAFFK